MRQLSIINYHGIEAEAGEFFWTNGELPYVVSTEDFGRQLQYALDAGYQSLDPDALKLWLADGGAPAKPLLITFDDGHLSHFRHAASLLRQMKMRAIFFVSPGLVGRPGYMSWEHLRALKKEDFDIGAHGYHHVPLPGLPEDRLIEETAAAKSEIEDRLGEAVRSFSIPRGFYCPKAAGLIREAGYEFLFTSHFGQNPKGQNPFYLKRMAVRGKTSLREFGRMLAGDLGHQRYVEEIKEWLRRVSGPRVYELASEWKAKVTG